MKIYVDVTVILGVSYVTGIQRVVREVLLRMLEKQPEEIALLRYDDTVQVYEEVNKEAFLRFFGEGIGSADEIRMNQTIAMEDFQPGDVFFDIDSVWNLSLKRSVLLPKLKANGVKLAVYIYDIIPITHPQFCHKLTVYNFMNYLGAYLQYADLIIASAQSTLDAIDELTDQLQLPHIPGVVSWLGSDFKASENEEKTIHPEAVKAVEAGSYVLMVGTLEPRKNHAVVLEAFEKRLFAQGINLIFAGKIGWNMERFEKQLQNHPKRGSQFFHLQGMDDATIDYLYAHAFCVAFPTEIEGFGLPIIEAFQRGTPVLASDIPILREVGGTYCSYFTLNSWESFADKVTEWMEQPEQYSKCREALQSYSVVTWDTVADTVGEALRGLETWTAASDSNGIHQLVYEQGGPEQVVRDLDYIRAYMPFIRKIVIRAHNASSIQKLQEQAGDEIQIQAFEAWEALEDVFLLTDCGCRPIAPISEKIFENAGIYNSYVLGHLGSWKSTELKNKEFEQLVHKTGRFLTERGYSDWMYIGMPQIVNRQYYCEMLQELPDVAEQPMHMISIYFNYMHKNHSNLVRQYASRVLTWQAYSDAEDMVSLADELLFENYQMENYEFGGIYEGCSEFFYADNDSDNQKKIMSFRKKVDLQNQAKIAYQTYCANYELLYGELPFFGIELSTDLCKIQLPQYVIMLENARTALPFRVEWQKEEGGNSKAADVSYRVLDVQGRTLAEGSDKLILTEQQEYRLSMQAIRGGIKGALEITVKYGEAEYNDYTKLCMVKRGKTK